MKVLALGCHPDDIEFGCGGTLSKYATAGHDVYMMVMTEGHAGGDDKVRKLEQERAAEIIGCEQLFWGGYRDTELPLTRELIQGLERVIDQVEPAHRRALPRRGDDPRSRDRPGGPAPARRGRGGDP